MLSFSLSVRFHPPISVRVRNNYSRPSRVAEGQKFPHECQRKPVVPFLFSRARSHPPPFLLLFFFSTRTPSLSNLWFGDHGGWRRPASPFHSHLSACVSLFSFLFFSFNLSLIHPSLYALKLQQHLSSLCNVRLFSRTNGATNARTNEHEMINVSQQTND